MSKSLGMGDMSTRKLKRTYFRLLRRYWRGQEKGWGNYLSLRQERDSLRCSALGEVDRARKLLLGRGVQL